MQLQAVVWGMVVLTAQTLRSTEIMTESELKPPNDLKSSCTLDMDDLKASSKPQVRAQPLDRNWRRAGMIRRVSYLQLGGEDDEADKENIPQTARQDQQSPTTELSPEDEMLRLGQIRLLACARGTFQMARICFGPLVVNMSAEYTYTPSQKGAILSAFAGGYAMTQVAGGIAADRFGGKPLLFLGLMSSSASLLVLPYAADAGVWQLWWLLWVMGFLQGPTYPAQLVTTAKWATGSLRSYASALGGAGSTAGSLLALGLTPVLATRIGWRCTSGFFGIVTMLFGILWHCYGQSTPAGTSVSPPTGQNGKSLSWAQRARKLSANLGRYARVLLAPSVLVIFVAHAIHNFVRYFVVSWMPTYYSEVLRVSADASGVFQILPELCGLGVSMAGANIGKRMQQEEWLSPRNCRRLFVSIAFLGSCVGLLAISMVSTAFSVTLFLCCVQGLSTLQGLGFGANYLDISKHHSGLVTGVGNTVATIASYMAPVFASWLLAAGNGQAKSHIDMDSWRRLFLAFSISNVLGLVLYLPFCSTVPVDEYQRQDSGETRKTD